MTFALRLLVGCALAAPVPISTSTYHVAVSSDAAYIEGLKAVIAEDQKRIVRARAALKRARARADGEETLRADKSWQEMKLKLKLDRQGLRQSIEVREKELARARRRGLW